MSLFFFYELLLIIILLRNCYVTVYVITVVLVS